MEFGAQRDVSGKGSFRKIETEGGWVWPPAPRLRWTPHRGPSPRPVQGKVGSCVAKAERPGRSLATGGGVVGAGRGWRFSPSMVKLEHLQGEKTGCRGDDERMRLEVATSSRGVGRPRRQPDGHGTGGAQAVGRLVLRAMQGAAGRQRVGSDL